MAAQLIPLVRVLVIVPWVLFRPTQPPATGQQSLEYEVKAAYLLNFLGYTEWPTTVMSADGAPMRVCIAGRDPFGRAIDRVVQGQQISGRPVAVERLAPDQQAEHCELLFVPASVAPGPWLTRAGPHTLTVGESGDFIDRGGMIELAVDAGRVRFDVNIGAAAARKIRLSSRLLRLARTTVRGPA